MIFSDLAARSAVFIDANTFVYYFVPHPVLGAACADLIARIERDELNGITSTHVLSEVAHRLMTHEAETAFGWANKAVEKLKLKPALLQKLSKFHEAITKILNSRIQVLTIAPSLILTAATISQQTGLLSNDALIIAVMQANGLTSLASHDADFNRVPGITRYAPA